MAIVRPVEVDAAPDEVRMAYERMAAYAADGLRGVRPKTSPLLGSLGHHPPLLHQHVAELTATMVDGALPRRTKEVLVVAFSMATGCRYCTTNHSGTLRTRFGATDAMLVEVAATVAHVAALIRVALLGRAGAVAGGDDVPAELPRLLGGVPPWYRALAGRPAALAHAWEREQTLIAAAGLDAQAKAMVGFAVAAALSDPEAVSWYAGLARRRGCTEAQLGEAVDVLALFGRVNSFTIALQLEPVARSF